MPDLTPEQLTQLDTNIKKMVSQGASQSDVESYAKDFKAKYAGEKKKSAPTTTPSPSNGSGQSGSYTTPSDLGSGAQGASTPSPTTGAVVSGALSGVQSALNVPKVEGNNVAPVTTPSPMDVAKNAFKTGDYSIPDSLLGIPDDKKLYDVSGEEFTVADLRKKYSGLSDPNKFIKDELSNGGLSFTKPLPEYNNATGQYGVKEFQVKKQEENKTKLDDLAVKAGLPKPEDNIIADDNFQAGVIKFNAITNYLNSQKTSALDPHNQGYEMLKEKNDEADKQLEFVNQQRQKFIADNSYQLATLSKTGDYSPENIAKTAIDDGLSFTAQTGSKYDLSYYKNELANGNLPASDKYKLMQQGYSMNAQDLKKQIDAIKPQVDDLVAQGNTADPLIQKYNGLLTGYKEVQNQAANLINQPEFKSVLESQSVQALQDAGYITGEYWLNKKLGLPAYIPAKPINNIGADAMNIAQNVLSEKIAEIPQLGYDAIIAPFRSKDENRATLTGLKNTMEMPLSERIQDSGVANGFKNVLSTAAFIGEIAAGTGLLEGAGVGANTAQFTSMFAAGYPQAYYEGLKNGLNNVEAMSYAATTSGVNAAVGTAVTPFSKYLETPLSADAIGAFKAAKNLGGTIGDKLLTYGTHIAKTGLAFTEGGLSMQAADNFINGLTNTAFGSNLQITPFTLNTIGNTIAASFIGSIPIGMIGGIGRLDNVQKESRYFAALDPEKTYNSIDNFVKDGSWTPDKAAKIKQSVAAMSDVIKNMPTTNNEGKVLTPQERIELANNIYEGKKLDKIEKDNGGAVNVEEQKKEVQNNIDEILSPELKDKNIEAKQKEFNLPDTPTILLSDDAKQVMTNIQEGADTPIADLKDTIDELHSKYKGLAGILDSSTRQFTTQQINKALNLLGHQITETKNAIDEKELTGELTTPRDLTLTENKTDNTLNQQSDAVPQSSTEKIPVQPETDNSKTMGEGNTVNQEPTQKGETQGKQEEVKPKDKYEINWKDPEDWEETISGNQDAGTTKNFDIEVGNDKIIFNFKDRKRQENQIAELDEPITVNLESDNFNRVHIGGISDSNLNQGFGKEIYHALIDNSEIISTGGNSSEGAERVWNSLIKNGDYYWAKIESDTHNPVTAVAKSKEAIDKFVNKMSNKFTNPTIERGEPTAPTEVKTEPIVSDTGTKLSENDLTKNDKTKNVKPESTEPKPEKKVGDIIRKAKGLFGNQEMKFTDKDGNEINIETKGLKWDDVIEDIARFVDKAGDVAKGISDWLGEQRWFTKLDDESKAKVEKDLNKQFEERMTGITHEQTDAVAKSLGLPTYQEKPETVAEWDAEADKRIAEDPHIVGKILDNMREGNTPKDPVEQRILIKYAADLQAKIEKNPADTKLLNDYQDFKKVSDVMGGQLVGKLLKARDGKVPVTESLADMLLSEKESTKVDNLTEGQVKKQTDLFAKIKKAKDDVEAKLKEAESEIARLKAEKEFKKQKTANTPNAKKTHTDFINERKDLLNQWKELSNKNPDEPYQSGIPLTDKHIKIIGKFVKSYVDEGITNLKDVVGHIALMLGLDEKDVHDVIAGKYNEPLPTKAEVQKNIADLKYEAKLINELDSLMKNGIPKTEAKRIEHNKKIKELRDKIKDFKKDNPNLENEIQKVRDRNLAAAKKWKEKLDKGEFTTKKKEGFEDKFAELKQSNPKLWNETMDAIIKKEDAQNEFYIGQKQNELNNRKFNQKVRDAGLSANATLRAVLTGIDDSAVFVQNIVALIAHPKTAVKALPEHLKDAFSEKRFNRQLAALHNSPMYWLMQKSGLSITEPKALRGNQHEEIFDKNLLNKSFKVKGKEYNISKYTTKPFERMFTSLGNNTRADAFLRMAEKLYSTGYTWENDPESFTSLAKVLNNETGRPALPETVERASGLLTAVLWSPRLLTSTLNILGVSDAASLISENKGYYRALTPRMKLYAIADFAKFASAGVALMAVFALQGWDADLNPLSTKFGTVSIGGKSINIFGRFSGVVKLASQMIIGKRVIDGLYQDLSPKQRFLYAPTHFIRGKTTPLLGAGLSTIEGKDYTGQPTDWKEQGLGLLAPLSIKGIADGIKNEGISSVFTTGLPSFAGINVSYEDDFKKQMPDTIKHNGEDIKLTKEQQQQFQNSYDTHEQDYLNILVNTEKYKNSDDAEKLRLQQMVSYWAHQKSEQEIKESYPQEFGEITNQQYEQEQKEKDEMEQLKENIGIK